ncbi:dATP pyrophosphohydrolase [Volucribacter psittacicida]|uniref:dATP pyrophosphohydrolase n=1 Tax=Volucribacter psittacicida TaxID=203482 RepID=A0A4R1G1F5_9PAST|nr:dihydroneopterin triphosphate diphosphatase [Volucribacter psittacicida]TCK01444.1 dATP pyrophosphohydrolase [Volucribacter psittacicida]
MSENFKNPKSVLVVVYAVSTGKVLMLQRKDDPDFWQSVSGSIETGETAWQAAQREVWEEIGLTAEGLIDCQQSVEFEIFPQFRYKYAPYITHCLEHWFLLPLAQESAVKLTEHLSYQWLTPQVAATLTKSWNNGKAIEQLLSLNNQAV